jgi:hypothetical protein
MPLLPILDPAYGLPARVLRGAASGPDANGDTWQLLLAADGSDAPAAFLQSQERPEVWTEYSHSSYCAAVSSVGARRSTPVTAAVGEVWVSVRTDDGGFARAEVSTVISCLRGA